MHPSAGNVLIRIMPHGDLLNPVPTLRLSLAHLCCTKLKACGTLRQTFQNANTDWFMDAQVSSKDKFTAQM